MSNWFRILFVTVLFSLFSCGENQTQEKEEEETQATTVTPAMPYPQFTAQAKKRLHSINAADSMSALQQHIFTTIANKMPAYWTGTKWDFNGTTRTAGEGTIACGYFVTTVLEDMGFRLNRVKLSQQASSVMINSLCSNVKRFSNYKELEKYCQSFPGNAVFIVGLDFHTGFILKENNHMYFFHSNYIKRQGVIKQPTEESGALKVSKSFMIGSITHNTNLLKTLHSQ